MRMNKRQKQIVVFGAAATVLVIAWGTSRLTPPATVPVVETAPGRYSQSFPSAVVPKWAALTSLGVAILTAAFVYRCRKQDAV